MVNPDGKNRRGQLSTEQKILGAARKEFIGRGLRGARMQSIADTAGVNKALLHYYFRSKQRLYEAALHDVATAFWEKLEQNLHTIELRNDPVLLIRAFVGTYVTTMETNRDFPRMILREIADGGDFIPTLIEGVAMRFGPLIHRMSEVLTKEIAGGKRRRAGYFHFIMNIMGMCAVPFIAQPIMESIGKTTGLTFRNDRKFYEERVESIMEIVQHGMFRRETE
jgi:TetR/AcrR family transcriptional regulator